MILFTSVIAIALGFRLWLTLGHDALLGVDGGAYFDAYRQLFGGADLGVGFPSPPLAPGYLLWPFVELFGVDIGYKVWSSIASVLPAIPVYLLARRIGRSTYHLSPAVFAAGFILLDLLHAEMLVTGALPLIGFALLAMVWWAMGELAEDWSLPKAAILAASLGLIPWVNQTTAGLAIVTIPVYLAALLWFHSSSTKRVICEWCADPRFDADKSCPYCVDGYIEGRREPRFQIRSMLARLLPALIVGGIIALGALPWYMKVLPVSGVLNYPGAFLYLSPWTDSSWLQVALSLPLGMYIAWRSTQPWLRSMGVIICLLGALTPFLSTDETIINVFYRSRYLLALPFYVAISWCVFTRWVPMLPNWGQRIAVGATVATVAILGTGYWWTFNNQAGYSDMVTRDTEQALTLVREADDGKAIINNSFTLALWVAALNEVEAPHTWTWQPPRNWTQTDKNVRCVLGWIPGCVISEAVHELNAGWVLIENRFPYYNDRAPGVFGALNVAEPWSGLPTLPWLELIYAAGSSELYQITAIPSQ